MQIKPKAIFNKVVYLLSQAKQVNGKYTRIKNY